MAFVFFRTYLSQNSLLTKFQHLDLIKLFRYIRLSLQYDKKASTYIQLLIFTIKSIKLTYYGFKKKKVVTWKWCMIKISVLTAGALPPAWCSLFLCASRYWLKGFWSDGPTLGTDLTHSPAYIHTEEQRKETGRKNINSLTLSAPLLWHEAQKLKL